MSVNTRFAVRAPLLPGLNVTLTLPVPPFGAIVIGSEGLTRLKSDVLVPVSASAVITRGAVPGFETGMVIAGEMTCDSSLPKFTGGAGRPIFGTVPLPARVIV